MSRWSSDQPPPPEVQRERAVEDVRGLRALQWFGEGYTHTVDRTETAFSHLNYAQVREVLKDIDYDAVFRLVADRLRRDFSDNHSTDQFSQDDVEALKQNATDLVRNKAEQYKITGARFGMFSAYDPGISFHGGPQTPEAVRIYLTPQITVREKVLYAVEKIVDAMSDLRGNMKIQPHSWFTKREDRQGWRASERLGRVIVAFSVDDQEALTTFFSRLSASRDVLGVLEDSGKWAETYRIPLAPGVNFVEGYGGISWDMDQAPQEVIPAKQLLKNPRARVFSPQSFKLGDRTIVLGVNDQQKAAILQSRSLDSIGRHTLMPGLRKM